MKNVFINSLVLCTIHYTLGMEYTSQTPPSIDPPEEMILIKDFYQENIQPFIALKQSCQTLHLSITYKMIAQRSCQDKSIKEKNNILANIMSNFTSKNRTTNLPVIATILVHAGADPNMVYMAESLLHKALQINAQCLIEALFEKDVDHTQRHFSTGPIFFDAPTVEIAQLFIDRGIDVNAVNDDDQNVLWHIIDAKFSPELVSFYLAHKVNVKHIRKWDKSCIFHALAGNHHIIDENNFLTKARLLLKADDTLINKSDSYNQTPISIAHNTIYHLQRNSSGYIKPLEKLIAMFRQYGGMVLKKSV